MMKENGTFATAVGDPLVYSAENNITQSNVVTLQPGTIILVSQANCTNQTTPRSLPSLQDMMEMGSDDTVSTDDEPTNKHLRYHKILNDPEGDGITITPCTIKGESVQSTVHYTSRVQDRQLFIPVVSQEGGIPEDVAQKRQMRLFKNREAAKECRRKKKEYIRCLENRVAVLENQNKELISELKNLQELHCQEEGE